MFQFRPFPPYAYLIQRTVTRYCRVGFPHSEICGYNGYLLLPAAYRSLSRPSSAPDAKAFPLRSFQLDLVGANCARSVSGDSLRLSPKTAYRFVAPPLPRKTASLGFARRSRGAAALRALPDSSLEMFGSLKNYAGNLTEDLCFTKLLPFTFYGVVPQSKL